MSTQDSAQASLAELLAKTISVEEASERSGFTPSWLRRLLMRGAIPGIKVGRDWRLTPQALQAYLEQERRPGPKTN